MPAVPVNSRLDSMSERGRETQRESGERERVEKPYKTSRPAALALEFIFYYRAHIKFAGCNEHSNHIRK